MEIVAIPTVTIRPSFICAYTRFEGYERRRKPAPVTVMEDGSLREATAQVNRGTAIEGKISPEAAKSIRGKIDWFLALTPTKTFLHPTFKKVYPFKVVFVTLTLSSKQIHSDQDLKQQLLNQFLVEARKKWRVKNYLWRAESQENGNIHFHLLLDKYVHWSSLRTTWNRIQNKLGYIDRFEEQHGHRDANSTDVHSVKKVQKLARYFAKYLAKDSKYRPITGKLWSLSDGLARKHSAFDEGGIAVGNEVARLKEAYPEKIRYTDFACMIYMGIEQLPRARFPALRKVFDTYVDEWRTDMSEKEGEHFN